MANVEERDNNIFSHQMNQNHPVRQICVGAKPHSKAALMKQLVSTNSELTILVLVPY